MDDATKLLLYNAALRLCGEGKLASVSENREPRRLLDDVFNNGGIDYCLEQGMWNFAVRTQQLSSDPAIAPAFGYSQAFALPDDYIRMAQLSTDPYFAQPLIQYSEEGGYIFCEWDTIYLSYISNSTSYGADASLWPQTFKRYVESHFAAEICERLLQNDTKLANIMKIRKTRLTDARSKDAMESPIKFPPVGSWVMARRRGRVNQGDGGNRNSLYG